MLQITDGGVLVLKMSVNPGGQGIPTVHYRCVSFNVDQSNNFVFKKKSDLELLMFKNAASKKYQQDLFISLNTLLAQTSVMR